MREPSDEEKLHFLALMMRPRRNTDTPPHWGSWLRGGSSGATNGATAADDQSSASATPSYSPAPPVYDDYAGVPEWKRQFFRDHDQAQNWIDFNQATGYLPGSGAKEKSAYREIFAAEGAMVPNGSTVSGITAGALSGLHRNGKLGDWAANATSENLTSGQRAEVYRAYMDDVLHHAGGHEALESIDHSGVAAFVADTVFRHGQGDGTRMIQQGINATLGNGTVLPDGVFGTDTLRRLNEAIQTPEGRQRFAQNLRDRRDAVHTNPKTRGGDWLRGQHFYALATQ